MQETLLALGFVAVQSFVLFLVVRSNGGLVGKVAGLVEQQTHLIRAHDDGQQKAAEQMIELTTTYAKEAMSVKSDRDLQNFVRTRGLMPLLQDAQSAVNMQIQAVAKQLNITPEQAVTWIRSQIEDVAHGNEDR